MANRYANRPTVEISGTIEHETDNAYLFNDGAVKGWVPKSQVPEVARHPNGTVELHMYEWIAKDKGFI